MNEHDLRETIAVLIQACKAYQARALSLNSALSNIMDLPPTKRAELTKGQIQEFVALAQPHAERLSNETALSVEKALTGATPFLEELRAYHWAILSQRNRLDY